MPVLEASTNPIRNAVYICDRCGWELSSPTARTEWGNVGCRTCMRHVFDLYCADRKLGVFGHGNLQPSTDIAFE